MLSFLCDLQGIVHTDRKPIDVASLSPTCYTHLSGMSMCKATFLSLVMDLASPRDNDGDNQHRTQCLIRAFDKFPSSSRHPMCQMSPNHLRL